MSGPTQSVFAVTIWQRRKSTLWLMLGMAALAGLTVAFFPAIRGDSQSYENLFESMPEGLLSIFGIEDPATLVTAVGLVNSRIYSGIGPVILAILGISLGTASIVGEEERGTLDLLLAQPISRTQLVVEKFSASAVLVAAVVVVLFFTLAVLNPLVDLGFTLPGMIGANLTLGLLALSFCTLSLALGAVSGRHSFTIAVSSAIATAMFFVNGLAPLVDEIAWMRKLTLFYWLQDPNPLANGPSFWACLVFVSWISLLLALAIWGFNRRDVGV